MTQDVSTTYNTVAQLFSRSCHFVLARTKKENVYIAVFLIRALSEDIYNLLLATLVPSSLGSVFSPIFLPEMSGGGCLSTIREDTLLRLSMASFSILLMSSSQVGMSWIKPIT